MYLCTFVLSHKQVNIYFTRKKRSHLIKQCLTPICTFEGQHNCIRQHTMPYMDRKHIKQIKKMFDNLGEQFKIIFSNPASVIGDRNRL